MTGANLQKKPLRYPIFYLFFAVFKFPFVRDQEIIPILPFIIFGLLLFLKEAIDVYKERKLICISGVFIFIFLTSLQICSGAKMSSAFSHIDTSTLFRKWILNHINPNANIYCEPRTIHTHFFNNAKNYGMKIERIDDPNFNESFDFLIRAPKSNGRGMFNPITGKRFPNSQKNFDNFSQNASLLKTIDYLEDNGPIFGALPLELWAFNKSIETNCNNITHTYVNMLQHGSKYYVSPSNHLARVFDCLRVVDGRSKIRLALNSRQRYWAVTRLEYADGPKKITWDKFFSPRSAEIAPGHTMFFTLDKYAWINSLWNIWPECEIRIRANKGNSLAWVFVSDNPAVVSMLLEETNDIEELNRFKVENGITNDDILEARNNLIDTSLLNYLNYKSLQLVSSEGKYFAELPCLLGPGKYKLFFNFADLNMTDNMLEVYDFKIISPNSKIVNTRQNIVNNKIFADVEIEVELDSIDRLEIEFKSNSRDLKKINTLTVK